MSKSEKNMVPHFYIIWKMLKHPPIGRPPVAGKNWILTPASTFAEHFLKELYRRDFNRWFKFGQTIGNNKI